MKQRVVAVTVVLLMIGTLIIGLIGCGGLSDNQATEREHKYTSGDIVYVQNTFDRIKYLSSMPRRVDIAGDPLDVELLSPRKNDKLKVMDNGTLISRGEQFSNHPIFYKVEVLSKDSKYYGEVFWIDENYVRKERNEF